MAEITGVNVAVGRHFDRTLVKLDYAKPVFVGLLAGYDSYYGAPGKRVDKMGVKGGKMRFNFITDYPRWDRVDALNPDYSQRRKNVVKRVKVLQAYVTPSSMDIAEPIDKAELNAIEGDAPFANWIGTVAELCVDDYLVDINEQLFPGVNLSGNNFAYGPNRPDEIMAFAYPLQSGAADNEATGATEVYDYINVDMNQRTGLKAINKGTTSAGWTLSERALLEDFIMPLRQIRGSNVDMCILDGDCYSYLRQQLVSSIQRSPEKMLSYPGEKFKTESGIWFIYEPRLDLLTSKRELYIGDSSTLLFGWDSTPTEKNLALIKDWPEQPTAHLLQGFKQQAFVNREPQKWGRAYNVTIP